MGQGNGRVVLPGGLQGAAGVSAPSTQQMLMALAEQAEWPEVAEWLVLDGPRMNVVKAADGTRILNIWGRGSRRGYRIPLNGITAAMLARELGSGEAVVPESAEVAGAHHAPAPFEPLPTDDAPVEDPPQPPTMGQ